MIKDNRVCLPDIFCLKNVSIRQRAEQNSATHTYYMLGSGGKTQHSKARRFFRKIDILHHLDQILFLFGAFRENKIGKI